MMRALLALLAALALCQPAAAQLGSPSSARGMAPDASNAAGLAARRNLGVPDELRAKDFGGVGGALQGPANYSASAAPAINITAVHYIYATISCTLGSGVVTVSPASAVPLLTAGTYYFADTDCGISNQVSAVDTVAGTITVVGSATANFSGASFGQAWSSSAAMGRTALNGQYYGPVTASGQSVVLGNAAFSAAAGNNVGTLIDIAGAGPGGNLYEGAIISQGTDGKTVTVSPPLSRPITGSTNVYWGRFLFSPGDVGITAANPAGAATRLSVPGGGTAPSLETIGSISAYGDPLNVSLSNSVGAFAGRQGVLTKGVDDWPAFVAALQAAPVSGIIGPNGSRTPIYVQKRHFFATPSTTTMYPIFYAMMCGEGQVYWPSSLLYHHGVGRCNSNRMPQLDLSTGIVPSINLKGMLAAIAGGATTITIDFIGNSQFQQYTNDMSMSTNWSTLLCKKFKDTYKQVTINCNYRAIGGQTWLTFDPTGPYLGIPPANPFPTWYSPTSATWSSFLAADAPHVVIAQFTTIHGSEFVFGSFLNSLSTIAAYSSHPDIIIALDGNQPLYTIQGHDMSASIQRSWAEGGNYTLPNGGRIGVIDLNRAYHMMVDGYDVDNPVLKRAFYQPPATANAAALPYTWPRMVQDFALMAYIQVNNAAASMTTWWAALGGELDILVSSGAQENPAGARNGTDGSAVGYPGGVVRLIKDAGGNFAYQYDLFRFTTGADCTASASSISLVCTVAEANYGHKLASISVPGAGTSGAALVTTISGVSLDGKTITLAAPTVGAVTNVAATIYYTAIPYTVSRVPYTWTAANNVAYGNCLNNTSSKTLVWFEISMVGEQFNFNFCGQNAPGANGNFDIRAVPRFHTPFFPVLSAAAGAVPGVLIFQGGGGTNLSGGPMGMFEGAEDQPEWVPETAVIPDIYSWCSSDPIGSSTAADYGGQCGNHHSSLNLLENMTLNALLLR